MKSFVLMAQDETGSITQTLEPFALTLMFTEMDGLDLQNLSLRYWDEESQQWVAASDAVLTVLNNMRIRAQLLYFGQYALVTKESGGAVYLPLVERS